MTNRTKRRKFSLTNRMINLASSSESDMGAQPPSDSVMIEHGENEFGPLSGKPYFHLILSRSHVKPAYIMTIPAKVNLIIPSLEIPSILTYKGKSWHMKYLGGHGKQCKRIDKNWRKFVDDNDLKIGDACVFELMECSSTVLKFRVQILRGDFPSELKDKLKGESADGPIIIE